MSEKLVVKPAVEQEERLASRVPMLTELTIGLLEDTFVFASIIVSGSHPTGYIEEENSSSKPSYLHTQALAGRPSLWMHGRSTNTPCSAFGSAMMRSSMPLASFSITAAN